MSGQGEKGGHVVYWPGASLFFGFFERLEYPR